MPFPSSAPDRWTVLKFGGSSVSSRARWDTIGTIAAARAAHSRVLIVVSALSGVTNMLQFIARDDEASLLRADALRDRHRSFALEELGLEPDMLLQTRWAERMPLSEVLFDGVWGQASSLIAAAADSANAQP